MLASHSGLLDDSLFERAFWFLVRAKHEPIGAQLIVHDADAAFGFRAYSSPQRGGPWHVLGSGYSLFAAACPAAERSPDEDLASQSHVPGFVEKLSRSFTWSENIPVRAQAMVLAKNALLLAGTPDVVKPGMDPYAALEGELGARLLFVSREDGKTLAEHTLQAPPVWDGMAVAAGRVYMAGRDGAVACMAPSP
jgi:hypothetical protein